MTIRAHLLLSYLGLICFLTLGIWLVAESLLERFRWSARASPKRAYWTLDPHQLPANRGRCLTSIGQLVVKDKAEDVARDWGNVLRGRKTTITTRCGGTRSCARLPSRPSIPSPAWRR